MKVTPEDIALPDITLRIHQEELALDVSKDVQDALRIYAHSWKMEHGVLVITVSGSVYRDHIAPLLTATTKETK